MMRRIVAASALLIATVCLAIGSGCKKNVEVIPVTGKVHLGSDFITSGQVTFIPMEEKAGAELSSGTIDSSGEYKVFTGGKHGAPAGRYKVTVSPPMMPTADGKKPTAPFDAKFMDAKNTPLQIEVKPNAPQGAYNLTPTK